MIYMLGVAPAKENLTQDQNLSASTLKQEKQRVTSSSDEKKSSEQLKLNGKIDSLIALAQSKVGAKYLPGGKGPESFD
jgi:hypothetical protein